jgi:hypothetical protein
MDYIYYLLLYHTIIMVSLLMRCGGVLVLTTLIRLLETHMKVVIGADEKSDD